MNEAQNNTEQRHIVVYGYTRDELTGILKHFEKHLPEYIKLAIESGLLVSKITLIGQHGGVAILSFQMNRLHQNLRDIFTKDVIADEDKTLAQVLGDLLKERELTVACAESCTGGNIAHRITQQPGSSEYFLGSIVSYANDVKTHRYIA